MSDKIQRLGDSSPRPERPLSSRAQWASAIFAGCAVFGVAATIANYTNSWRAERGRLAAYAESERHRQTEQALARMYQLESDISRYLADRPDAHICLDDDAGGELWRNQTANERVQFRAVSAMVGDELEYYLLIRDAILTHPRGGDIVKAWDNNLRDYCRNSYGFRAYIARNPEVWTPMFLERFKEHTKGLPDTVHDKLADTRQSAIKK